MDNEEHIQVEEVLNVLADDKVLDSIFEAATINAFESPSLSDTLREQKKAAALKVLSWYNSGRMLHDLISMRIHMQSQRVMIKSQGKLSSQAWERRQQRNLQETGRREYRT